MSADVEQLRTALHLAVDLACDILARNARRAVRAPTTPTLHEVSETDQAFAKRELERAGWLPRRAGGAGR